MDIELPYMAEYAKSGRAICKGCKCSIPKDNLRIAVMIQSAFHDAKVPNWFHKSCFLKYQRPGSVGVIQNFGNLRFTDQKELTDLIEGVIHAEPGQKRSKSANLVLKDFGIEYAKSSRSTCRGCEQKINKDQVRLRKTVYDTEVGMKYGGQPLWHHLDCFAQLRTELGWFDSGENMLGYTSLKSKDQKEIKNILPAIKSEELPDAKKIKIELADKTDGNEEHLLKIQNDTFFKFRDELKSIIKKADIKKLLEINNVQPITGDSERLLDQAADLLTFGAIESCSECASSQFIFNRNGYICNGNLSEWTKCTKLVAKPTRSACQITKELRERYPLLNLVRKLPSDRIIQNFPPSEGTFLKNSSMKGNTEEFDGYWIFRSWGRIGTSFGSSKIEEFDTSDSAKKKFKEVYADKTGNEFDKRHSFVNIAGCIYPIEIQYDDDQKLLRNSTLFINSKLDPSSQNLIMLMFDVDSLKRTLMEFHIDMDKMPLGKLSVHQIKAAYSVINEIFKLIETGTTNSKLIDTTNRFYTLVPHNS
ncbi:poly [ADP-ribose] polymerase isoform X5 [Drosophila biarmipes]|uniref:poly [ADP-ribose] polymerase isoform X5 n=1 Tax=Drosophila biarmipes TaxID=125945 RepID=UPI0021CC608F|nr:poly [ADP-ribose] polymerase isoform X5 [Drosophila biarmipes]